MRLNLPRIHRPTGNPNKSRGIKDDLVGGVDSKIEIVAVGQEKIDIDSLRFEPCERVEDYLVDPTADKIIATIPD
jgi:hypothetical protein